MRSNFIHTFNSVTDVELTGKGLIVTAVVWRETEGNICHLVYVIWDVVTENDPHEGLHPEREYCNVTGILSVATSRF